MIIGELATKLAEYSSHPQSNFELALEYDHLGQTAAAISFYLRAAEFGAFREDERLRTYAALVRISVLLKGQSDRNVTVNNVLLQAIAHCPDRPEAYFLMSQFHEQMGNWQECYTWAAMGMRVWDQGMEDGEAECDLPVVTEFPGYFGFTFQKAISAYWIGRKQESLDLLRGLDNALTLLENTGNANPFILKYQDAVSVNLGRIYAETPL